MSSSLGQNLLNATDEIDAGNLPADFRPARDILRTAIGETERIGVAPETLVLVLMSETMPRLVDGHGPITASRILEGISRAIVDGVAPCGRPQ